MRRIVATTVGLMLLFYGACGFPYSSGSRASAVIDGYVGLQARLVTVAIRFFDATAALHGKVVTGAFSLEVIRDCCALDVQALFAAAVLGFPAAARAKCLGLGAGFVWLNLANVARIASLYAVGARWPGAFDTVHEELMPLWLVACACGAFALWVAWARSAPEARGA